MKEFLKLLKSDKKDLAGILNNIKTDKFTTGTGIALLLLVVSNLLGYNVGKEIGIDNGTVVVSLGAIVSALINLISKDPKGNEKK